MILFLAKCVDTYISQSAMQNPPSPANTVNQQPPQLTTAFPSTTNGAASAAASMASPTTPFSQSALPSKSLLSRQDSSTTFNPSAHGGGNVGVSGSHTSPLVLPRHVQKNLQAVIQRLFESCFAVGAYHQVVGIAIEARKLEVLRQVILRASQEGKAGKKLVVEGSGKGEDIMEYVLDICMNVVQERGLRNEVCGIPLRSSISNC